MSVHIRALVATDAEAYGALRLRTLAEHPDAFLSSVEEESRRTVDDNRARLADKEGREDDMILGAHVDGELVGMIGAIRDRFLKSRHRAIIWGMYVAPEARCRGVGAALLDHAIDAVSRAPDVEQVHLSVVVGNHAARRLYRGRGFVSYGVEPRVVKLGDEYYDDEHMVLFLEARGTG